MNLYDSLISHTVVWLHKIAKQRYELHLQVGTKRCSTTFICTTNELNVVNDSAVKKTSQNIPGIHMFRALAVKNDSISKR